MEIWEPKPPVTLWATPGLLRDSFTFIPINTINQLDTTAETINTGLSNAAVKQV